jgi:hypothetical protein
LVPLLFISINGYCFVDLIKTGTFDISSPYTSSKLGNNYFINGGCMSIVEFKKFWEWNAFSAELKEYSLINIWICFPFSIWIGILIYLFSKLLDYSLFYEINDPSNGNEIKLSFIKGLLINVKFIDNPG